MSKIYTTGQIAEMLGVHKNTIFLWLRTGKIKEPKRDKIFNGRIWTEKDLNRIKKLLKTKRAIFPKMADRLRYAEFEELAECRKMKLEYKKRIKRIKRGGW